MSHMSRTAAGTRMVGVPVRLLFVCMGNICRSPTAEAVMRHLVAERGLEHEIEIDSAGTGGWHAGASPDPRSCEAAARRGITLTGTARQVTYGDFEDFDLLLAADSRNLRELRRAAPPGTEHKARLLADVDVPDPYYGQDGFDLVLDIVEDACARLLDELKPQA
jgi:protein-tyrosine phosphatase